MLNVSGYEIDESKINLAVTQRLLTRAVAHILNNECAANVLGKTKRAIVGKDGKPDSVTETQLTAWREQHSEVLDGWESEFCQQKIAAMYDGSLSVRVARAPTRDPVEAAMRAIAKAEVVTVLKNNGAKFPKDDETVSIEQPNGETVQLSGDELVDRRLAHATHGDRIRKAAERKVAEDKRLREATSKAAGGGLSDL